jgi:predicted outer membrane repeat protein
MSTGTATLKSTTVSGNAAGGPGGGMNASSATLTNVTVSGNTAATDGGGIRAFSATLINCTVVENHAQRGGGLFRETSGTFNVRNTIVALNLVAFAGTGPDVSGLFTSQGHNLIGDVTGGTGFTDGVSGDIVGTNANPIDPKLDTLANNGGKTKTRALLAGSPAIDRGDNSLLPPTDQRGAGFARKNDGNGDGVAIVDIGAFER